VRSPLALFITFEGGEGTGKTTQVKLLVNHLEQMGEPALALREPGDTPLGDYLRAWLKAENQPLTSVAELFLFAAARAELVRTVIKPALASGTHVVLDRYVDSTTVYQGDGRGLPSAQVRAVNNVASGGLTPHATFLLDAPLDVTLGRTEDRQDAGGRRFEDEARAFHRRVQVGFLRIAKRNSDRWFTIDASPKMETVHENIWACIKGLFPA
jgi:dTMP kinase